MIFKLISVKQPILKYLYTLVDCDFGWINFISGIMVSASVNIFTGYCVTVSPSIYQCLASVFSFVASIGLFILYQRFNYIGRKIDAEVAGYNVVLSQKDYFTQRKILWKKFIDDSRKIILLSILLFVVGTIGLVLFLVFSYLDYNNITLCIKDVAASSSST